MKLGILTYHRAHNYGAILQCYALQEVLRGMGHDVEVIDYRQPYVEHFYRPWNLNRILAYRFRPAGLARYILREIPRRQNRAQIFRDFRTNYLRLSRASGLSIPSDFDGYVIGSDQLWSCNCLGGSLDPIYFGRFPHRADARVVGYAISSNPASLNSISASALRSLLDGFDQVSVREQTVAKLLEEKTGTRPVVTIDPTLLTTGQLWESLVNPDWSRRRYVLVYYVGRPIGDFAHTMLLQQAHAIAESRGCEVVDLSDFRYSVVDFVSAFRYAECVVTSSFHASVFSVIFRRPFYAVRLHDGNDDRYVNLLESLGLERVLIEMDSELTEVPAIDYPAVMQKLEAMRLPSLEYLKTALSI